MGKLKQYWVPIEIYCHKFNVEIDMTDIGDIGARYEPSRHWMPYFGKNDEWEVRTIEGLAPFILQVGVKRKGGKRTAYFRFDLKGLGIVENKPVSREEVEKIVHSMAKKIFQ